MKKLFLTLCLLLGLVCAGNAQTLKFNANGKFKIVQFTDVHYCRHSINGKSAPN